ncbi:MAG: TIGR01906 family membrane protein [Anaerolineales bacterium]|jgi:integral membrane protein (TIGR01906 family)
MKAAKRRPDWVSIATILVVILVPLVSLLTSLRFLLTDAFVWIEYHTPAFPADPYGFTLEDRLYWAPIGLDYLLNDEPIEFLSELQFEDGEPVFNARELRHMEDVKRLTQALLVVWFVGLGALALLVGVLWRSGRLARALEGLKLGSRVTLIAMGALALTLVVAFSLLFVGFHRIFFEGDTWLFLHSDTLIRLFPERFWRDTFIFVIALTSLFAALIGWIARRALARLQRAL